MILADRLSHRTSERRSRCHTQFFKHCVNHTRVSELIIANSRRLVAGTATRTRQDSCASRSLIRCHSSKLAALRQSSRWHQLEQSSQRNLSWVLDICSATRAAEKRRVIIDPPSTTIYRNTAFFAMTLYQLQMTYNKMFHVKHSLYRLDPAEKYSLAAAQSPL